MCAIKECSVFGPFTKDNQDALAEADAAARKAAAETDGLEETVKSDLIAAAEADLAAAKAESEKRAKALWWVSTGSGLTASTAAAANFGIDVHKDIKDLQQHLKNKREKNRQEREESRRG